MRQLIALSLIVCCCGSDKSNEEINSISDSNKDSLARNNSPKEKASVNYRIKQIKLVSKIDCTEDKTSCAQITINYPEFRGLSQEVDKKLQSLLARSFVGLVGGAENTDSLRQVAENYIRHNEEELYNYQQFERAWLTADILVELLSDSIFSLSVNTDWWGYGHYDNRSTKFINFNPKSGEKISLNDIVNEKATTKLIAVLMEKISTEVIDRDDQERKKELSWLVPAYLKDDRLGFSEKGFLFDYSIDAPFVPVHSRILIPYQDIMKND